MFFTEAENEDSAFSNVRHSSKYQKQVSSQYRAIYQL